MRIHLSMLKKKGLVHILKSIQLFLSQNQHVYDVYLKELATTKSYKADLLSSSPSSDKEQILETSTLLLIGNTKLPCHTLPLRQHHSFFRNLPPSSKTTTYFYKEIAMCFKMCLPVRFLDILSCFHINHMDSYHWMRN